MLSVKNLEEPVHLYFLKKNKKKIPLHSRQNGFDKKRTKNNINLCIYYYRKSYVYRNCIRKPRKFTNELLAT
jgi:hypothetical protein